MKAILLYLTFMCTKGSLTVDVKSYLFHPDDIRDKKIIDIEKKKHKNCKFIGEQYIYIYPGWNGK
jgi:hypothetical protein